MKKAMFRQMYAKDENATVVVGKVEPVEEVKEEEIVKEEVKKEAGKKKNGRKLDI